jgi:tetratricopeptide (TPR) repeat protein
MSNLPPKELLKQARKFEKAGKTKDAATAYLRVAQYCMKRTRWREAHTLLLKAGELAPHSSRTKYPLAVCEWRLGNEPQGERLAQMAARESVEKGRLAKNSERAEEEWNEVPQLRIAFFEIVLQLERTSAAPYIAIAFAWLQMNDGQKAKQCFLYALKAKGDKEQIVKGLRKVAEMDDDREALTFIGRFEEKKISEEEFGILMAGGGHTKMQDMQEAEEKPEPSVKPLGELIRQLEKDIGLDLTGGHDSIGPLLDEFRRRSQPILQRSSKARIDMACAFREMGLVEDACDELSRIPPTDRLYNEAQCLLGQMLVDEGSLMLALEAFQKCLRDEQVTEEISREAKYALLQVYLRLDDLQRAEIYLKELEKDAPDYRQLRNLRIEWKEKSGALKSTSKGKGPPGGTRGAPTQSRKRRVG